MARSLEILPPPVEAVIGLPSTLPEAWSGDGQPFRMVSDDRARRVARNLRNLLRTEGVAVTAPRAQALTAALYGYPSWTALVADLGPDFALDDGDVSPVEVEIRHRRSLAVILGVLPSLSAAGRLLAALGPTATPCSRPSRSVVAVLDHPAAFHPVRLRALVEDTESVRDGIEDSDDGELPPEALAEAALALVTSSCATDDLTLLPYDVYALLQRRLLALHAAAGRVTTASRAIIDAESVALAMASRPIPSLGAPVDHYVHLGHSRFPSPYPGLGIEGCYLRSCPDGDIAVAAVLSSPIPVDDGEGVDTAAMLLGQCRGHTMGLSDILDGGLAVPLPPYGDSSAIGSSDARGRPPYAAGLDALWRTALRPVAAAALNALARARTAPVRSVAIRAGGAASAGPTVQILGSTRTAAETGFVPDALPVEPAFWPTGDAQTWLRLFVSGGTREYDVTDSPDVVYEYARLVAPDRASFLARPVLVQTDVLIAALAFLKRLMIVEDLDTAADLIADMLGFESFETPVSSPAGRSSLSGSPTRRRRAPPSRRFPSLIRLPRPGSRPSCPSPAARTRPPRSCASPTNPTSRSRRPSSGPSTTGSTRPRAC